MIKKMFFEMKSDMQNKPEPKLTKRIFSSDLSKDYKTFSDMNHGFELLLKPKMTSMKI